MKTGKLFSLILSFALLLTACTAVPPKDDGNLHVVASFAPIHAITLAITDGAEGITVDCMAQSSTGCLHDYQLTASDMQAVESADIFLIGGAGMEESFLDTIATQYPDLPILDSSGGVQTIAEADGHANPHLWLSTGNAAAIAKNIALALSEWDQDHAELYKKNAEAFCEKLAELKAQYAPLFDSASCKKIITFHEAFAYLAEEFGIEVAAVIETEPGMAPDPQTLAGLIDVAASGDVAAIFTEPQYPDATAQVIAEETGVPVLSLDPIVTGEMDADTFLTAFQSDLQILSQAVK